MESILKVKLKKIFFLLTLLVAGIISLIYYNYNLNIQNNRSKKMEEMISEVIQETGENIYSIGNIVIDKDKEEIRLSGRVVKRKGWVQCLVYVKGYSWLEDEAAIISDAQLKNLQLSLAFLDWNYWNEFYYKNREEKVDSHSGDKQLELFLQWEEDNKTRLIPASDIILTEDTPNTFMLSHFIFLGNPLFDRITLIDESVHSCQGCPLFIIEQKVIRKQLEGKSLQSGYEIYSQKMPPLNVKIDIIIRKCNLFYGQE